MYNDNKLEVPDMTVISVDDVAEAKKNLRVGEFFLIPVVTDSSAYPLEVGKVVAKSTHCFVIQSLMCSDIHLAFQYTDLLVDRKRIYPENTGLNSSKCYFEDLTVEEAAVVRDFLRRERGLLV